MSPLVDVAVAFIGVAAGVMLGRGARPAVPPASTAPESRLQTSEEAQDEAGPDARFEQLLRSLTVGIVTVDENGRIEALNAAAAALFELSAHPVVGRAIIELIPSFELDRRVRDAVAGEPSRGRISLGLAGGARVLTVATLPLDGSTGALIIAADETRLHELEQTRREFISNVSHELRTPLASVKLMLDTIEDTHGEREALELFLPRIGHEVNRMIGLIEDLLDLTRAESGGLRLRREPVDLAMLSAKIVRTFEARAQQQGIDLRAFGEETFVDGDPDRLAQVLVNLVDNALRHTPRDGSVAVEVRNSEAEVSLVVRDTGVGIPYNDLPHVFERFYVVDRSRAREATGTGLGLSIVKGIVEAHGGTVSADSVFGEGTTLTCVFPGSRAAPLRAAAGA